MTVNITIIGLGQIGVSLGMALAKRKDLVRVSGHDKSSDAMKAAKKIGAFDDMIFNLPASVEKADIVVLALPFDEIRDTLNYIKEDLRENVIIMETAPAKRLIAAWMKEILPAQRHYVGLVPCITPDVLNDTVSGYESAREDLFHKGMLGIVTPFSIPSEAVELASNFARLVGAQPFFMDIAEADNLTANVHLIPQLISAAMVLSTYEQSGWREGRKLAGRSYAFSTHAALLDDKPSALAASSIADKENVVRGLDGYISALMDLRETIKQGGEDELKNKLNQAAEGRTVWWNERSLGNWLEIESGKREIPSLSNFLRTTMFGKLGERKTKE